MRIKMDLFVYHAPKKGDFSGRLLDARAVKDVMDLPTQGVADVYSDVKWVRSYYQMRGHRVFEMPHCEARATEVKLDMEQKVKRGRKKSVQPHSDDGLAGVDNSRHEGVIIASGQDGLAADTEAE